MNKLTSLVILVKSLSKAEKRYFRLQTNLQNGEKNYLYLYELLEKECPIEEIPFHFGNEGKEKSLEIAVKHLYKVFMDCLMRLREKQNIQAEIFNSISKAEILYERDLFEDAFRELGKAKKLAVTFEKDSLLLLIYRTELHYLSSLGFPDISEKELVSKQMKINEVIKYIRNANQHLQLYNILKYRLTCKGFARSEQQKERLNDLVLSELHLIANTSYQGFEVKKLHMIFQATYFLNCGNYSTALRYYRELIELFETNRHLMLNPPVYYFSALQGILDSLQIERLYNEVSFFVRKLEDMENGDYSIEYKNYVRVHIFLYKFNSLIQTGEFSEAGLLIDLYKEAVFEKIEFTSLELQLKLQMSLVIYDIYRGDLRSARKNMRKILGAGKIFHTLPSYRITRLVNILLQAESRNYELMQSEIASIKRNIRSEKHIYMTEQLVFKFLQFYPIPSYEKARINIWDQLRSDISKINENKYEKQLVKTFDFPAWIESKLTRRPLQEILSK